MEIQISDLRQVCTLLFLHLEQQGHHSVEIPYDFYWNISSTERYDVYAPPSDFTIGQLTDDWNELKKMLDSQHEPLPYGFVWLSAILRAIGETYSR